MLSIINKKSRAFTLTELLVSIGIFLVILFFILVNFHGSRETQTLEYQTKKALTVIEKAQNLALTGFKMPDGSVPYYGLHITADNRYFIIFADSNPANFTYDSGEELAGNIFDLGASIYIEDEAGDLRFQPTTGELYDEAGERVTDEFKAYTVSRVDRGGIVIFYEDKEIYMHGLTSRVVRVE
ncbi:type II secretion system GspH family protein [Patescibacteria group bacterium]|nr:type II secretion system GspH family protein [Patescibacteria group bacterium]MBU4512289.1 type II secretion system GspH family protein [Patescibacteria group bacterium]MCG2693643.1 type II secretion system GspH family protein [Candidatus Parcubacteria bacterium]